MTRHVLKKEKKKKEGKKEEKSPRPMEKRKDYFEPTFSITISFVTLTN